MKNLYFFRRLVFLAVALVSFFLISSPVQAQTFKRGVLIEEATGTWCVHCALGAWAMDTLEHRYGDKAVVIAWHGPGGYPDPMIIEDGQGDTVLQSFGISSFPNALVNRYWPGGFGDLSNKGAFYVNENIVDQEVRKAPSVDYRIVNATYNEITRRIEFDIDITPFDVTKMKSEDTTNYVTVAVITEDGISEQQANTSNHGGYPNGYIDFIHDNVARKAIGKVMGDKFTLGTGSSSPTWPKRVHYGYFHDASWEKTKLQVKTFIVAVSPKNKFPQRHEVLEAEQTGYITSLPTSVQDMVYVFPLLKSTVDVPTDQPIQIVYGKGGNVTNVKLEYTIDNGTTWQTIVASTTQSPYSWTLPTGLEGKTVKLRASNATNAATNGVSEPFEMKAAPQPEILVTNPFEGAIVEGGKAINITFVTNGPVTTNKTISYSLNGGVDWTEIVKLTTDVTTYSWMVPDSATSMAMVRVQDETTPLPAVGTSGFFTIEASTPAPTPVFKSFKINEVSAGKLPANTEVTFVWEMENGVVPGTPGYIIEMSASKTNWSNAETIVTAPQGSTTVKWTTPTDYWPAAYFRITNGSTEAGQTYIAHGGNSIEIGTQGAVKNNGGMPTAFNLSTNYPNPFATMTNINFDVPERSFVTLVVRNELGQEVARLASGMLDAGSYTADFDASKLPAGLYTYTLESGATKLTGKMSVVR